MYSTCIYTNVGTCTCICELHVLYLVFDVVFLEVFEELLVCLNVSHLPSILPRLIGVAKGPLITRPGEDRYRERGGGKGTYT